MRILEIRDPLRSKVRKIKARLDTGADHSIISRDVVDNFGWLEEALDKNDPASVVLPDHSLFSFRGKVTINFHVLDPPQHQTLFRFNKYEYKATFFIPADGDIASFDAYIGRDLIAKHHLQSSFFFSGNSAPDRDGRTLVDKGAAKKASPRSVAETRARLQEEQEGQADRYDRNLGGGMSDPPPLHQGQIPRGHTIGADARPEPRRESERRSRSTSSQTANTGGQDLPRSSSRQGGEGDSEKEESKEEESEEEESEKEKSEKEENKKADRKKDNSKKDDRNEGKEGGRRKPGSGGVSA